MIMIKMYKLESSMPISLFIRMRVELSTSNWTNFSLMINNGKQSLVYKKLSLKIILRSNLLLFLTKLGFGQLSAQPYHTITTSK